MATLDVKIRGGVGQGAEYAQIETSVGMGRGNGGLSAFPADNRESQKCREFRQLGPRDEALQAKSNLTHFKRHRAHVVARIFWRFR